ncbi:MAG: hypothetical protein AAF957_25895 [Planctomycetota bacterium]
MSSTPTSPTGPPNPAAPTHVVAVLFRAAPALETLHARLRRIPDVTDVVAERDHVRLDTPVGVVHASTYGAPWPDEDPESLAELGGVAASLYPGALARAGDQSALWPGGALAASAHRGFVHLIVAEAVGGPRSQIEELERLAVALLADPDALCVFFPAGESLRDGHVIGNIRESARAQDATPLQIWVNGRLADVGKGVVVADVVGLGQIGLPDAEAVFPERPDLAPFEVLGFLLDVAHHLAHEGGALEEGVVYEGPGGLRWRAGLDAEAQIAPERRLVRWIPLSPSDDEGADGSSA